MTSNEDPQIPDRNVHPDRNVQGGPQNAAPAPYGAAQPNAGAPYVQPSNVYSPPPAAQGAFVPATYGAAAQFSRNNASYSAGSQGSSRGTKIAVAIIIIVLLAALAGMGFFVYKESQKAAINQDLHSMTQAEMKAVDEQLTGTMTFEEPFTMLLLGSDAREDDPDMGARTDTIILMRIDPKTNTISMLSIPRDTKVDIPGVGTTKINSAYYYGGAAGAISAVRDLTGVNIDHYAEINFEGLVDLIDAIGGVDVVNDELIDDPDAGDIVIEEGEVHLDGASALVFARSRAFVDGDYTRQRNQRKVIEAIAHKGLEAPASELAGLIQASTKFLTTDSAVDFDFIYSLADQIRHNNDYPVTIYSATPPPAPAYIGDVSYVIADTAGTQDMVDAFLAGEDIGDVSVGSSIDQDIANAGANTSSSTIADGNGTNGYGYDQGYYYEDQGGYYEEPVYDDGGTYDASNNEGGGGGGGEGGGNEGTAE